MSHGRNGITHMMEETPGCHIQTKTSWVKVLCLFEPSIHRTSSTCGLSLSSYSSCHRLQPHHNHTNWVKLISLRNWTLIYLNVLGENCWWRLGGISPSLFVISLCGHLFFNLQWVDRVTHKCIELSCYSCDDDCASHLEWMNLCILLSINSPCLLSFMSSVDILIYPGPFHSGNN